MSKTIQFQSRRVGPIEVLEDDVVVFEPIPGFAGKTRFVLVEHAEGSEMAWLVSLDDPDLAFVVTAPWSFFPNYDPPVERDHLAALGIEKRSEVEILSIVTLSGQAIYLNLAAPLLINATTRRGLQVISDDPRYTTRAAIPNLSAAESDASAGKDENAIAKASPATAEKATPTPL